MGDDNWFDNRVSRKIDKDPSRKGSWTARSPGPRSSSRDSRTSRQNSDLKRASPATDRARPNLDRTHSQTSLGSSHVQDSMPNESRRHSSQHSRWGDPSHQEPQSYYDKQGYDAPLAPRFPAESVWSAGQVSSPRAVNSTQKPFNQQLSQLMGALHDFSDHAAMIATVRIQRDYAERHLAKMEDDYSRDRKHHLEFPALAEQQEQSKIQARKEFTRLDEKLKQDEFARGKIVEELAVKLLSANGAVNDDKVSYNNESRKVHKLENELRALKSHIWKLENELPQSFQTLQGDFSKLEHELSITKDSLKNLKGDHFMHKQSLKGKEETMMNQLETAKSEVTGVSQLRKDVSDLRSKVEVTEVSQLREDVSDLRSKVEVASAEAAHLKQSQSDEKLSNLLEQITDLAVRHEKISAYVDHYERSRSNDLKDVSNLSSRLDEISEELKTQKSSQPEEIRSEVQQLKDTTERLASELKEMKLMVSGETEGEGLVAYAAQLEGTVSKLRTAFKDLYDDFCNFETEFGQRVTVLEAKSTNVADDTPKNTSNGAIGQDNSSASLERLQQNVTFLFENHQSLRDSQEEANSMLIDAVEAVKKDVWAFKEVTDAIKKDFDTTKKDVELNRSKITQITSQLIDKLNLANAAVAACNKMVHNQSPAARQQSPANNGSTDVAIRTAVTEQQNTIGRHAEWFKVLADALRSIETRINNLTTEELFKSIVNQMQEMYPYASKVQAELENLKVKQEAFDRLSQNQELLQQTLQEQAEFIRHLDSAVSNVHDPRRELDELKKLVQIIHTDKENLERGKEELEQRLDDLDKMRAAYYQLTQDTTHLTTKTEMIGALKEAIDTAKDELSALRSEFDELWVATARELGKFRGALTAYLPDKPNDSDGEPSISSKAKEDIK
ncbi:MAG: hypothetical protein M1819_006492 [Sarea resinae]|nr:MAG: hypothetical protein M1819_006492 [Sarea resinae]